MNSNQPMSEQFRICAKAWADAEAAASLLEESKSAVLAQRMAALGDVPINRAERDVKSSEEWGDYIKRRCAMRGPAPTSPRSSCEYIRMKYSRTERTRGDQDARRCDYES